MGTGDVPWVLKHRARAAVESSWSSAMGGGYVRDMVHAPELGPYSRPDKAVTQPEQPKVLALGSAPMHGS